MKHFVVFIVAAFLVGLALGFTLPSADLSPAEEAVIPFQAATQGLTAVDANVRGNTISLRSGCGALVFDVTPDQAFAIAHGIDGTLATRPLTHDVLKDVLNEFGAEAKMFKIDRFEDGIYKATWVVQRDNLVVEMDARPSDSIATALRLGKPIFVSNDIMDEFGVNVC